jgi:outer membrane receptor protein involved in Fe transport
MSLSILIAAVAAVQAAPSAPPAASTGAASYPAGFFAPFQPNTALDMLGRLPGFTLDTGDAVRGFGGAAGNVLIDGARPAAKDDTLDAILRRLPASSVLRIDLIRGGAPGIDMQGKTVIANVIRRRDGKASLTLKLVDERWYDGRQAPALGVEGSRSLGGVNLDASMLVAREIDNASGDGRHTETAPGGALLESGPEHSAGDVFVAKGNVAAEAPVFGGKLRLHGSLSRQDYSYVQNDYLLPTDTVLSPSTQDQDTGEVGLDFARPIGPKAMVDAVVLQQLGRNAFASDLNAPGDIESFRLGKTTSESIARVTFRYQPARALALQFGAEGDFNTLSDHTVYVVNATPTTVPAAKVRVTETRGEGFGTATWMADPRITLETGLRIEASQIAAVGDVDRSRALVFPKPRAVLTWSPKAADQFRLRIERTVDQLNFDDFAASQANLGDSAVHAGNPNLTPQQAWVFEAAYERRFWGSGDATLTVRHSNLTDVIDRAPIFAAAGPYDAPGNIGGGRKDEAVFAVTLPLDRLGMRGGQVTGQATWRSSRVIDPTTGAARPISNLQPLDYEAHFAQGLPSWKSTFGVDVFGHGTQTAYDLSEIDSSDYGVFIDPFVEYKPRADLAIRFEAANAAGLAEDYTRVIYNGPRNAYGLSYIDSRRLNSGPGFHIRIRKTFG